MTTTLLGVDDSKTMRKVLEITFAGEDYKTVLAENADDAMSKLHAERPSVVLVDAALDGTNGYELCQRVKAAAPNVGVVLLASKQQPYDRARGAQVGADDFVDKPFDTQQLIDKVGAVLRRLSTAAAAPAVAPAPAPALSATASGLGPVPQPAVRTGISEVTAPARARSQTLAYGQTNPMMPGGGPVAPVIPPPVAPPRSSPVASAAPIPAASPRSPAVASAGAAPTAVPPLAVASPAASAFGGAPAAPAAAPFAPAPASAPAAVSRPVTNGADFSQKLAALGLTAEQVSAVVALSREVVERVVWEVVPTLAETMIREEIKRLTAE